MASLSLTVSIAKSMKVNRLTRDLNVFLSETATDQAKSDEVSLIVLRFGERAGPRGLNDKSDDDLKRRNNRMRLSESFTWTQGTSIFHSKWIRSNADASRFKTV